MIRRPIRIAALVALAVPAVAFTFGGWAIVTVDSLPEYMVAGTPTTITFTVRQHGMNPLGGLKPYVAARNGSTVVEAKMGASSATRYSATLTLPHDGAWTIDLRSNFLNSPMTIPLMPTRVVAAGAPAPSPLPDVERGKHLFVAKGCVTCHVHPATNDWQSIEIGPNLTGRRYDPAILAAFLDDPDKSTLSKSIAATSYIRMPKLGLDSREIASLVAFVNGDKSIASRTTR